MAYKYYAKASRTNNLGENEEIEAAGESKKSTKELFDHAEKALKDIRVNGVKSK